MPEHQILEVAICADSIGMLDLNISKRLDGYVGGIFKLGKVYGAINSVPGRTQSYNNPIIYETFKELSQERPELAKQIDTNMRRVSEQVSVYEVELMDEKVLNAMRGLPHVVTTKEYDKSKIDALRKAERRGILLIERE